MLNRIIGKRIKELRTITNDLNQEQLASLVGCDRAYLSRIESWKQNITIGSLNQICNALGVSLKNSLNLLMMKSKKESNGE